MHDKRIYRTHFDGLLQVELQQLNGHTVMVKHGTTAMLITGSLVVKQPEQVVITANFNDQLLLNLLKTTLLTTLHLTQSLMLQVISWGTQTRDALTPLLFLGTSLVVQQMLPNAPVFVAVNTTYDGNQWRIGRKQCDNLLMIGNNAGIILLESNRSITQKRNVLLSGIRQTYQIMLSLAAFVTQIAYEMGHSSEKKNTSIISEHHFITRRPLLSYEQHLLPTTGSSLWMSGDTQVIASVEQHSQQLVMAANHSYQLSLWTNFINNIFAPLQLMNKLSTITINDDGSLLTANVYADLLALADAGVQIAWPIYAQTLALCGRQIITMPNAADECQAHALFNVAGYDQNLLSLRITTNHYLLPLTTVHEVLTNIDTTSCL